MSIEIERIDDDRREEWDSAVEQSPQSTLFHRYRALEVQAEESGAELTLLMGFKGQEPVGVCPVFELSKGPVTGAFSPPPNLWVPKLGPAFLNMAKLKQRKRERRRRRFVDGVFEWLDEEIGPRYVRLRTSGGLDDARPFKWNDCAVTPEYTYVTDLTPGRDAVLEQFSSDARSNVRQGEDADGYTIEEGGVDAVDRIMDQVKARYDSQGEPFPVPNSFPRKLYERLPDGRIRPYVFRTDEGAGAEEFVGGILAYDDGETVARWHGGVKPAADVDLPVNDLLDWRLMSDAIDRGRTAYDLVGAGNPRLNRYKAKFAPDLEGFYEVERSSAAMNYLMSAYRRFSSPS